MKKRDLWIHAAVSFADQVNGVKLINTKDIEICQFACEFHANKTPVKESHVKIAFDSLYAKCLEEMRKAGMIRP